jgi:hypothetical protein
VFYPIKWSSREREEGKEKHHKDDMKKIDERQEEDREGRGQKDDRGEDMRRTRRGQEKDKKRTDGARGLG